MTIFDALKQRFIHLDELRKRYDDNYEEYRMAQYLTAKDVFDLTPETLMCDIGDTIDEDRLMTLSAFDFGAYMGELEGVVIRKCSTILSSQEDLPARRS